MIVLAITAAFFVPSEFNKTNNNTSFGSNNIPISELHGSFSINHDNISELVGDADYVFIGQIISEDGTEYKNPVMGETEDGEEYEIASPYTNYTVSNLNNIKGELVTDTEISIQKAGGLSQDGTHYFVYEEDKLPIPRDFYIFYAYAQPDGSLLVSGPNSNMKINVQTSRRSLNDYIIDSIRNISGAQEVIEVQKVIDALDTQVETNRNRFVSTYDVINNRLR